MDPRRPHARNWTRSVDNAVRMYPFILGKRSTRNLVSLCPIVQTLVVSMAESVKNVQLQRMVWFENAGAQANGAAMITSTANLLL